MGRPRPRLLAARSRQLLHHLAGRVDLRRHARGVSKLIEIATNITTGVPFSWNPLDDLQTLFQFDFMRNAYAAGTAAAVAAGVVGYFVVLRSLSFAAHTLTQIGFAGATGALAASINPVY
ncbi:MAG: metal ABC transporter permease, partial [Candidatus Dormibacteraeota bacterium]|nr:metal ABC transporter permease [Candidatus Dormibacteraeota bacterium]